MAQELSQKAYPEASAAIAELFGLVGENQARIGEPASSGRKGPAPANLPVVESSAVLVDEVSEDAAAPAASWEGPAAVAQAPAKRPEAAAEIGERATERDLEEDVLAATGRKTAFGRRKVLRALKFIVPYVVIFGIGVFVYYYFLGNYSFTNFFSSKSASLPVADAKQKAAALSQYQKDHLEEYYAWVNQFYFEVSDPLVTDPNKDNSSSGLTNFQKFLLGLNPRAYDTLGTGLPDGLALTQGLDPLTLKPLSPARAEIVNRYVDLEVVNNRLALASLRGAQNLRGSQSPERPSGTASGIASDAAAAALFGSGLGSPRTAGQSPSFGQNVAGASIYTAPQTGSDYFNVASWESLSQESRLPKEENRLNLDKSKPGTLEISSLKITAPLIWTKDTSDFLEDLAKGVVHYPGTPLPGDVGTSYISGHSSNFAWAKGNYKKVFSALGDLQIGDSFTISVTNASGANLRLHYVVIRRGEYAPNDQAQFLSTGESVIALSTCWPVGTTSKRLVVFARLSQIEK